MKLNSISSVQTQNFGYNAQYHKRVHDYLEDKASKNDLFAPYALQLDKISLGMEDDLIKLEQEGKIKTRRYSSLFNDLVQLKEFLAGVFLVRYPKLEYSDNLTKQYISESLTHKNKDAADWRAYIVQAVQKFSYQDYYKYFGMQKTDEQGSEPMFEEVSEADAREIIKEHEGDIEDDFSDVKEKLVRFEQTQSSPKGFCDVVGLEDVVADFRENIIDYIEHPEHLEEDFLEYGIRMPKGYLFYGPPGCGKTYVTQALAAETGLDMYKMDISKFGTEFYNKTASDIQRAFDYLVQVAKKSDKPILLFMDEVDALAIKRDGGMQTMSDDSKVTTTLLKITQEARDNNIIIIAATNKYDMLDEAFSERLGKQVYFPPPDEKQIKNLLIKNLSSRSKGRALASDKNALDELAKKFQRYSARAIDTIIDEAAKTARRDNRRDITFDDVKNALEKSELDRIDEKYYIKEAKKPKVGF